MTCLLKNLRPRLAALIMSGAVLTSTLAQEPPEGRGAISGKVIDGDLGGPVRGAIVTLHNTDFQTISDLEGRFFLSKVPVGSYILVVSKPGFQKAVVKEAAAAAGEVFKLEVPLQRPPAMDVFEMEEFVVEAEVLQSSTIGLLTERQKSVATVDAIGSDMMSRLGAGDAAQALQKMTGTTVMDGKYVFIRGLGDRYTITLLDGFVVPSADPSRRAVQMDQFPGELLESVSSLKTFTPDKPGNFSGGCIEPKLKSFPDNFFLKISSSAAYNTNTTGNEEFLSYPGGNRDWLAMDDGTRTLPEALKRPDAIELMGSPGNALYDQGSELALKMDGLARKFSPYMTPRKGSSPPLDKGFSIALGDRLDGSSGSVLGYTASITWDRSYSHTDDGFTGEYKNSGDLEAEELEPWLKLDYTKSSQEVQWGAMASVSFKPSENHQFKAKYFHNQSANDVCRYFGGPGRRNYWQYVEGEHNWFDIHYTENAISSIYIKGEHVFEDLWDIGFDWRAGRSVSEQDEPDYRTFGFQYMPDTDYYWIRASEDQTPTRFFREMDEINDEFAVDLTIPFPQWSGLKANVKTGFVSVETTRAYSERAFEFEANSGVEFRGDTDNLFAPENVGINWENSQPGRWRFNRYVQDAGIINDYDGRQTIEAYYAMCDLPLWSKMRTIFGARMEKADMEVISLDPNKRPGHLDDKDPLPSINFVYALTEKMNLRASWTKTLARPNFREKASYRTFDQGVKHFVQGNPDLERTLITNCDLRWEWFLSPREILAVGLFYKEMDAPIEMVRVFGEGRPGLTWENVDSGKVYGVELETRKELGFISSEKNFIFTIGGNFACIESQMDVLEEELEHFPELDDKRDLWGQSAFVINADFSFENFNTGTVGTLVYNIIGKRLIEVSYGYEPDVYEQPRHSLDFIFRQRLWPDLYLKFAAKNLLDAKYRETQEWRGKKYSYNEYDKGRAFSVGLSYDF